MSNPHLPLNFQRDFQNYGVVGKWRVLSETQDLHEEMCLGDRLEFRRQFGGYAHWGVYVGSRLNKDWDHQVVHLGLFEKGAKFSAKKLSGMSSMAPRTPEILISPVEEILCKDKVRINNVRDLDWTPLTAEDIIKKVVHRFENQMDNPPTYHIARNNCEHFVNLCRYGREESCQGDLLRSVPIIKNFMQ